MVSALVGNRYATKRLGRELNGGTVGIWGMAPAAHALAGMLTALGARLIGCDTAVHHSAPVWNEPGVQPVTLPNMLSLADAVSVQILYANRFKGFVSARLLSHCRPVQIWVSISRSELCEPAALAAALNDGRMDACVTDVADAGFVGPASALHRVKNLTVTPRLGSHTHEARLRSSWDVAHRMHDTLIPARARLTHLASQALPATDPADVAPDVLADVALEAPTDFSLFLPSGSLSALGHLV